MSERPNRWPRYPQTLVGAWRAIEDLREAIDALTMHDRIQRAVEAALREHDEKAEVQSGKVFTRREKIIGSTVAILAILLSAADLGLRIVS